MTVLSSKLLKHSLAFVVAPALLVSCGDSSQSSQQAQFSLAVTDAPIDEAAKVVVEFTGVSLKPADGEVIEFTFDEPMSIDLLQLQGSLSQGVIEQETIPSGRYNWVRLHVNAVNDGVLDSYLELEDGTQYELDIPSGSQTGLKLVSGFNAAAGGTVDMTVDFDLRKSITLPGDQGYAIMRPTLRIVDNLQVGSVEGAISAELIQAACAQPDVSLGAVYLYAGADVSPADVQGTEQDPLASALVNLVDDVYFYEVGFVAAGQYTVAYTCEAGADDPLVADSITFTGSHNVTVSVDAPTVQDFDLVSDSDGEEPVAE